MNTKYRIQAFWKYFISIQKDLEESLRTNNTNELKRINTDMNEKLKSVCGCGVEVEMNETGFYEMTFATGGNKTAQIVAAVLKKDAPKQLADNWIINAFRPPLSEKAMHTVFNSTEKQYSGVDFKVYYTIVDATKTLELKVYCEGLVGMDSDYRDQLVAYMLELFIGELEFEARISHVEVIDEESDEENVCLLPNLYEDICDIIIEREWHEYQDPLSIYVAYKLDKKPVSDTLHNDRLLIVTTHPQLQEELINKEYVTSKEFVSLGGTYGYLYYEVLYEDEKEAILRQQLEKEIHDLLYPLSIARTIGGAIGIHYSYIDVAIFDKDAFSLALEKMNKKMKFKIYYKSVGDE
ncbi:MAG: hypothetical protein RR537_00775 [Longicatena sp.]